MSYHWHDELELIYLQKGNGEFKLDSKSYHLQEGQALFVNSGTLHSARASKNLPFIFYSIVFDLNLLNSAYEDSSQIQFINPLIQGYYHFKELIKVNQPWHKEIIDCLLIIINSFNNKEIGFELKIKSCLYEILYQFITHEQLIKVEKEKTEKIQHLKKALFFLHNNYQNKIKLAEIAEEINLSPYHFCRFFKEMTGKTPIDYLNYYRINQACLLLADKNKKILDIALEVGFNNLSYFIKTFKSYKGYTPSKYRDKN